MKKLLPLLLAAVILVSGCVQQPEPEAQPTGRTVTIEITSSGFIPDSVTISAGDTIVFVNRDSEPHWPASNVHPTHQEYPGLDARKGLAAGESYSFTFARKGVFGFHDHLNPSKGGTITVE